MTRIVVLGAGICGLAAGVLLHRDGHEVTVLERDPEPAPMSVEDAWQSWPRDGVTQFHQPHYLQSRGRIVLDDELSDVVTALDAAGALRFDMLRATPPSIADRTPRREMSGLRPLPRAVPCSSRRSAVQRRPRQGLPYVAVYVSVSLS